MPGRQPSHRAGKAGRLFVPQCAVSRRTGGPNVARDVEMHGSSHRPCLYGDLVDIRGSVGSIPIEPARAESLSVQRPRPAFELLVARVAGSLLHPLIPTGEVAAERARRAEDTFTLWTCPS